MTWRHDDEVLQAALKALPRAACGICAADEEAARQLLARIDWVPVPWDEVVPGDRICLGASGNWTIDIDAIRFDGAWIGTDLTNGDRPIVLDRPWHELNHITKLVIDISGL